MWYLLVYAVHRLHEQCGRAPTAQDVSELLRGAFCQPGDVEGELRKLVGLGYLEELDGRYTATESGVGVVMALATLSHCIRTHMECIDDVVARFCSTNTKD